MAKGVFASLWRFRCSSPFIRLTPNEKPTRASSLA